MSGTKYLHPATPQKEANARIVTRNDRFDRGMGQSPMVAEPASLGRRHIGAVDAAAAVRLPQRLTAP